MTQNKDDVYKEIEGETENMVDAARNDAADADATAGETGDSGTETDSVAVLQQALEQARAEAAEARDKMLRAAAEAENIRRRAENDVANAHKFAIERFAGEVLAVRDSLELARAVEIKQGDSDALAKMHEGLELTLKQLDSTFEKFNLKVIDPVGEKFNPEHHQAMTLVESDEHEPNHVVAVVQKGCLLHDRLIRPAMVMVSK
ncbi:MAG: nucleotide exchange factor GrpE [Gammaproteobacteria bacterium]|nr:nucleotide exchange factor GrpE [Gammaproteobacteria bacterium]